MIKTISRTHTFGLAEAEEKIPFGTETVCTPVYGGLSLRMRELKNK